MIRLRTFLFFVFFLLGCLPMTAQDLAVRFLKPAVGEPVFGQVEVEVAVHGKVREVIFLVDGREAGRLDAPPYRLNIDVGEDNREHRFEVIALPRENEIPSETAVLVTPAIRVDLELEVQLMQLYLTVTERGERVLNLRAKDFQVFDQGEPQELITFERGDIPITAMLLLDASNSMRGERLSFATRGALQFIDSLRELDQARLLLFSDHIRHLTPFTSFPEILRTGLSLTTAQGSTAINDHLFLALDQLEQRQGRRVVILLSDGIDVTSILPMGEVREASRRSQTMIYWIRLGLPAPRTRHASAWRGVEEHREELAELEQTVMESGGRILSLTKLESIPQAFTNILEELRDQYVLGYYPSIDRDDQSWHKIEVKLRKRHQEVRTREGYVDD